MKGTYVAIKNYEIHDGDGFRTTLFLKGCPLKCLWCHNPECISFKKEIGFHEDKCKKCELCKLVCPNNCHTFENGKHHFDRTNCTSCGKCVDVCTINALSKFGIESEADELIEKLLKDNEFFINLGGGVTISGGEPLSQPKFLIELVKKLKEKDVHISIDTSLYASEAIIEEISPYVDMFLVDAKAYNSSVHISLTGVGNDVIINNMKLLEKLNKKMEIRIPFVPGLNSSEMEGIANRLVEFKNITGVKVLPYHYFGKDKYSSLGLKYFCEEVKEPSNEEIENARNVFRNKGLFVITDN